MTTLGHLIETLGSTVVEIAAAPDGLESEVGAVVIHDVAGSAEVHNGDVLLGVGIASEEDAIQLMKKAGAEGAAAVALRRSALPNGIAEVAADFKVAAVAVPESAAWAQVVYLFQSVLSHGRFSHGEERLGGIPAGDLFALADAIAALVGAPVTVEDRMSRVLAFSADQQSADAQRMETVLGRRVPDRYLRRLEEFGVFEGLERQEVVFVDAFEEGMLCRLVAPVHAGGELLGSIWAAVPERPPPDREKVLADAAKLAALHLLRHRAGLDVERSLQADLLATTLDGGAAARESAERLGLTEGGFRVLAIASDSASDDSAATRLRDAMTVHLARTRVPGTAAVLGGVVLALIAGEARTRSNDRAREIAHGLVTAVEIRGESTPAVGVGGHASSLSDVPRSRKEAEDSLRVLRAGKHDGSVATIDEVRVQVLLTRFAEFAADEKDVYAAKIQSLIDSDQKQGSSYVESLRAYFEAFGDMGRAAEALHVHPNTLRYRLRRAQELSGIRLDDHNERIALMLLLSLLLEE